MATTEFVSSSSFVASVVTSSTATLFNTTIDHRRLIYRHFMQIIRQKQYNFTTQAVLITSFVALILIGTIGNGMVIAALVRNRQMRTPRNLFIVNLAVSDLTMCLLTQPLNLLQMCMYPLWNLGEFMCHVLPMLPATNVFVSTMSITAIALDRLQLTMCPTSDIAKKIGGMATLGCVWFISMFMASPVLLINGTDEISALGIKFYTACMEKPSMSSFRFAYSIVTMVCQYVLPTSVVIASYARISYTIRTRRVKRRHNNAELSMHLTSCAATSQYPQSNAPTLMNGGRNGARTIAYEPVSNGNVTRLEHHRRRAQRTNLLLLAIVAVFAISWLPLNIYNIVADFNQSFISSIDPHRLLFPVCHLFILCSACINPVLYGWLNDNFHREFLAIFRCCFPCCCCWATGRGANGSSDPHSPKISMRGKLARGTDASAVKRRNTREETLPATTTFLVNNKSSFTVQFQRDSCSPAVPFEQAEAKLISETVEIESVRLK